MSRQFQWVSTIKDIWRWEEALPTLFPSINSNLVNDYQTHPKHLLFECKLHSIEPDAIQTHPFGWC